MFSELQLKKILVSAKVLSEEEYKKHLEAAQKREMPLEKYLLSKKVISKDDLYKKAARYWKVPFVELKGRIIPHAILTLVPEVVAQAHQLVAFEKVEEKLHLACLNPEDLVTFEFIKRKTGLDIKVYLTTPENMQAILNQYRKGLQAKVKQIIGPEEKVVSPKKLDRLEQLAKHLPIIKIVDTIFEYASVQRASDIHIEPADKEVIVRYRIDGVLRDVITLPKGIHAAIVARIKVLASLKLDEHRLPQDGRFRERILEEEVSFRVSVIPTYWGEKIVLRLLKKASLLLTLDRLGLESDALKRVEENIKKPHGIILVTGPTGCGKTTTLYTVLNILNTPSVNICTIEDPIEYQIPRINQSQVNPRIGYTFAAGLRSLLRQDPNIIMVGEIRDTETADIAINAAMTGHLVLTTLHTNDAVTALIRLIDMGVPPFLIASTCTIVIAQRLIRKLCSNCKESYTLDKRRLEELNYELGSEAFARLFGGEKGRKRNKKGQKGGMKFWRPKGCKQCGGEGYKGRIGIFEVLEVTDPIADLVLKRAPVEEFKQEAEKQGMVTLLEDGFIKARNGVSSIEEILRVTRE